MIREEIIENLWGAVIRKNLDIGKSDITAIVDFVMENQEQPSLPEGLDEAAREWSEVFITEECKEACNYGFRVGAKWMAGQGYSKECTVGDMGITYNKIIPHIKDADMITLPDSFKQGDKVIVQIRKVNEKEK